MDKCGNRNIRCMKFLRIPKRTRFLEGEADNRSMSQPILPHRYFKCLPSKGIDGKRLHVHLVNRYPRKTSVHFALPKERR